VHSLKWAGKESIALRMDHQVKTVNQNSDKKVTLEREAGAWLAGSYRGRSEGQEDAQQKASVFRCGSGSVGLALAQLGLEIHGPVPCTF